MKTNKDLAKAGYKSERLVGKTLEKSSKFVNKASKSYNTWKEERGTSEKKNSDLSSSSELSNGKHNTNPISPVLKNKKEKIIKNSSEKSSVSVLNLIKTRSDIPIKESSNGLNDLIPKHLQKLGSFRSKFYSKDHSSIHLNKDTEATALSNIGKTATLTGKSIKMLSHTSNIVGESTTESDNSGGIKTIEKGTEYLEKKIGIKTSKYATKKSMTYTSKGMRYVSRKVYQKLPIKIKSKLNTCKQFKATFKQMIKVAFKRTMQMIKSTLASLILPMLSSIGAVLIILAFVISIGGGSSSSVKPVEGDPDFTNVEAWQSPNNPYAPTFYGQCTWFAWGRFYEIYGYSPGFLGNGNECVWELLEAHPDKFVFSKTPIPGAVGSSDFDHNHVFIVVDVEDDVMTIQDGNMNGVTDNWEVAITDWRKATFTMEEYSSYFGDLVFANPIYLPEGTNNEKNNHVFHSILFSICLYDLYQINLLS